MQVIVEYMPDVETIRAVGSMTSTIGAAGWAVVGSTPRADLIDGVMIESYAPLKKTDDLQQDREQMAALDKGQSAARALKDLLESSGWQNVLALLAVNPNDALPPNTIRIKVGFKPNSYFDPPEVKAARERMKKTQDEMNQRFDRLRNAQR